MILKDFVYNLYNPLWLVWTFRIPILENTYWWLLIYVLEALVFQNTSKWMLSSSSNQASFSSKYFYLKNHPEKHLPSFSPPWGEGIPSLLFIMFSSLLFTPHSSKTFLYWQNIKDFDIFKATILTLNIKYIKIIYIKSSFGFTFE